VRVLLDVNILVRANEKSQVPMRDPKDVVVLQTAAAAEAEIICTRDSDFYDPDTQAFCAALGIEVCTDVDLMNRLRPT